MAWLVPWKASTHMATCQHVILVLLLPALISSLDDVRHQRETRKAGETDPSSKFHFDKLQGLGNVTIQVGSTAYLHCPVINLGENVVSWVRRRDWHILSHDTVMFTKDDRFQLVPDPSDKEDLEEMELEGLPVRRDWVLMIKYVVARDSGAYECQVHTNKGTVSHRVELKVETPEAFILADEEYHIDRGSSLSLVCIIEKATEPPQYVFWYHNDRMINYDSERGISVTTTPGRKTHSQLSIQRADVSDSGNYTCAPSSSLPATIQVFVSGSEVKPWTSGVERSIVFFTTSKSAASIVLWCLLVHLVTL